VGRANGAAPVAIAPIVRALATLPNRRRLRSMRGRGASTARTARARLSGSRFRAFSSVLTDVETSTERAHWRYRLKAE
jgi:hypothetical protein